MNLLNNIQQSVTQFKEHCEFDCGHSPLLSNKSRKIIEVFAHAAAGHVASYLPGRPGGPGGPGGPGFPDASLATNSLEAETKTQRFK